MCNFLFDVLIITAVMTVCSQVLVIDVLNTAKHMCSRKTVILTVLMKIFDWKYRTTIWHYLAILCHNFKVVSLILTDLEHIFSVSCFCHPRLMQTQISPLITNFEDPIRYNRGKDFLIYLNKRFVISGES